MPDRLDHLQKQTEGWRRRWFNFILRHISFSPQVVTNVRLLLALIFPFLIISQSLLAWICISLSIILDAFDGVVARHKKRDTDRGKFIDVLADQITFVLLCLGLIRLLPEISLVLAISTCSIPLLYLIAIVRKNEQEPSDWLIKPQARLIGYKILFLILIVAFLRGWISYKTSLSSLWLLNTIVIFHFFVHYSLFTRKNQ